VAFNLPPSLSLPLSPPGLFSVSPNGSAANRERSSDETKREKKRERERERERKEGRVGETVPMLSSCLAGHLRRSDEHHCAPPPRWTRGWNDGSRREEERRQVTGVPTRDEAKRSGRGRATVISRSEKPRARFVVRLEAGQMHLAFYQEPVAPPRPVPALSPLPACRQASVRRRRRCPEEAR